MGDYVALMTVRTLESDGLVIGRTENQMASWNHAGVLSKSANLEVKKLKMQTTLIIDGKALSYAAYYTMGNLSYSGKRTGIIYGFLKTILNLSKKFDTNDFIICWDAGVTHRHQDYHQYKLNRQYNAPGLTEEELEERRIKLIQETELIHSVLPRLGFKNNFIQLYYEADDLMAWWVKHIHSEGRVIMVTSDSDMYQCLNNCLIYSPLTKKLFTKLKFKKKYGIKPEKWALAKAIGGCNSDNVKGIIGVSDPRKPTSKALKYIRGELNEGKIFKDIKANQDLIERNLRLVGLPFDDFNKVKYEPMKRMLRRRNTFTRKKFLKVFDKYHFASFLKKDQFKEWKNAFIR